MAYSAPKRWTHGDIPDAAEMNKYSDSLNAIHDMLGDAKINPAQLWAYGNFDATNFATSNYYMVHQHRWLIYRGDGDIVDPTGTGTTVTLTGSGTNLLAYDLDSISWMVPGKLYGLEDFVFVIEDSSPAGVSAIA